MKKPPTVIGASVRARLLRLARDRGEDYQLLLTRYANERLLYRLTKSPHGSKFVLKGAALFTIWTSQPHRATRDIDLLGFGDTSEHHLRTVFTEVLDLEVADDGVDFDLGSLSVGPIRKDQPYGGVRLSLTAHVTTAKVQLQVDVGFGDAITPAAVIVDFPALLDFEAPRLRAYPRETVVAEKTEAMVKLGLANSRMKDFYDLAVLSRMFSFDGALLVSAFKATFERRGTPLVAGIPTALTPVFTDDRTKNMQWTAFTRKSGASPIGDLSTVARAIAAFVVEPLGATVASSSLAKHWPKGGPWK